MSSVGICTNLKSEHLLTVTNNSSQPVVVSYKPCVAGINYEADPHTNISVLSHVKIASQKSTTLEAPILTSFINLHIPGRATLKNIPIFDASKPFSINQQSNNDIVVTHDFDLLTLKNTQLRQPTIDVLALIYKQIEKR